jgi:hypothetical protein
MVQLGSARNTVADEFGIGIIMSASIKNNPTTFFVAALCDAMFVSHIAGAV